MFRFERFFSPQVARLLSITLSWQEFELLLTDLGEKRNTRLAYYCKTLEIMSPLALHERHHRIIADIVKGILDLEGRNWEDFGSTTLKLPETSGVEPDTCFYSQNSELVRDCTDLNLRDYPPPDLAIDAYTALRVPEVWIYQNNQLKIYVFANEGYAETSISPTFPNLAILELIPQLVQKAIDRGTSKMLRELRTQFD